jgi:hypothetical protein
MSMAERPKHLRFAVNRARGSGSCRGNSQPLASAVPGTRHAPDDDVESGYGGRSARIDMPTLEERVATLEGRMTPDLREEMQRGFAETRQEFTPPGCLN